MTCLSSVCANDVDSITNDTVMDLTDNHDAGLSYGDIVVSEDAGNENTNNSHQIAYDIGEIDKEHSGTFKELNDNIQSLQSGDIYVFEKDYYFNSMYDSDLINGISIDVPNISLNGNNHRIDGSNLAAIFKVKADNVTIDNLVITNSNAIREYSNLGVSLSDFSNIVSFIKSMELADYKISPITWYTDYGRLTNCIFSNNTAVNGGVVSWSGNKGLINNSLFLNNTATGVGGAIYIEGVSNVISNSFFYNSVSLLSKEGIYEGRTNDRAKITNCYFYDYAVDIIEGYYSDVDVDIFYKTPVYTKFMDEEFNLVPMIYATLMNNANNITDFKDEMYTFEFNGNDLLFTKYNIFKFNETSIKYAINGLSLKEICTENLCEIVFSKEFHFSNVTYWNEVFNAVYENNYTVNYMLIQNSVFKGENAYEEATKIKNRLNDYLKYTEDGEFTNKALKISIESTKNIVKNTYTWNIGKLDCDVVSINGNGLTVQGSDVCTKEDKWAKIDKNCVFAPSNFIIEKFNNGIYNNGGTCIVNNMTFNENDINYMIDPDWGAGILNAGVLICNNCTFTNNTAQNGGAIFNQGLAYIDKYDHGNDVLNVDKGAVIVDGEIINGKGGIVDYKKSISSVDTMWIVVAAIAGAAVVGVVFGIGVGIGAGIGAGVFAGLGFGTIAYLAISQQKYDINYNRLKLAIICIGGATVAGAIGGAIGGWIGNSIALAPAGGAEAAGGAEGFKAAESRFIDEKGVVHEELNRFKEKGIVIEVYEPVKEPPNTDWINVRPDSLYQSELIDVNFEYKNSYKITVFDYDALKAEPGIQIDTGDRFMFKEGMRLYDIYGNEVIPQDAAVGSGGIINSAMLEDLCINTGTVQYLRPIGENTFIICDARGLPLFSKPVNPAWATGLLNSWPKIMMEGSEITVSLLDTYLTNLVGKQNPTYVYPGYIERYVPYST